MRMEPDAAGPAPGAVTFPEAAESVLAYLRERLGMDLWMVTRTEGNDWIVLDSADHGYGVQPGAVFRWSDSFCSRMVHGDGPRVAPTVPDVPVYLNAPIAQQVPIGAYIGVPLDRSDGGLFGTLCAIHPTPMPESIRAELPLVELLGRLLGSILAHDLAAGAERRRAEQAEAASMTDALTGLFNRRGWDHLLEREERRCAQYGHPACVFAIDLDGLKQVNDSQGHAAGDRMIADAGGIIRSALRSGDVAARTGGDEFFVLAVECPLPQAEALRERLEAALDAGGVSASVGLAERRPGQGLVSASADADAGMYVVKGRRRAGGGRGGDRD